MDPHTKSEAKYKAKSILGSLSDKLDVASAKLRGDDSAEVDVAIVKATLNDEVVPKEKHVRTLMTACGGSCPRQQVSYVIHGLMQRIETNKTWLVTLKSLIVFHRLMREVDRTFQDEMLRYAERSGHRRMLRLDAFADHATKETWDLSAWIRVYSVYLDERLEVYRAIRFDPEMDAGAVEATLSTCGTPELLERLPMVHKLMARLIACVPEGPAANNAIVVQACGLVLKEIRSVYRIMCEGIMNLADKFFEMERGDAVRGLELYKENVALNERLNIFSTAINNLGSMKGSVQFPTLQALPTDFQTTMEEYVRDAPRMLNADGTGVVRKTSGGVQAGSPSAAHGGHLQRPADVPSMVLHIGGPLVQSQAATAIPAPRAAAAEVDLLGADLSDMGLTSTTTTSAAPLVVPPAEAATTGSFFPGAWAAAPSQLGYAPAEAAVATSTNPFLAHATPPAVPSPQPTGYSNSMGPPAAMYAASGQASFPQQPAAMQPSNPFGNHMGYPQAQPVVYEAAGPVPPLVYATPAGPGLQQPGAGPFTNAYPAHTATTNPFASLAPVAAGSNPFGAPVMAGTQPSASGAIVGTVSPSPAIWALPAQHHDPLADLSFDLLSKAPADKAMQPSLKQLRD